MPEDLLQELEIVPSSAGNLVNIEDHLRVVVRDLAMAVDGLKGSTLLFEKVWRRIIIEVAKDQASEVQAARPRILSAFEKRFGLLKETHTLAIWFANLGRPAVPDPDVLLPEIKGMERLKARVFDHWQTAEDVEKLAAEHYPLSQERLEQIASTHAPPPGWYQGEEERLFQE